MKNIEAVIFDMDGVIFDTERVYLDIWTRVFEKQGFMLTSDTYISVMGTGRKNIIKVFLEKFGQDLPIETMYKEKDLLLANAVENNEVPMKTGAIDILTSLREKNIKIALATSAKRERANLQLKGANIYSYFDVIICGDEVGNTKPNPEIFLKASEKLDVIVDKCIVIEDSLAGIKAAFNAGIRGIHVKDLKEADDEIKKYSYKYVESLNDIKII